MDYKLVLVDAARRSEAGAIELEGEPTELTAYPAEHMLTARTKAVNVLEANGIRHNDTYVNLDATTCVIHLADGRVAVVMPA